MRKGDGCLTLTACCVFFGCYDYRPNVFHPVTIHSNPWLIGANAPRQCRGVNAAEEQLLVAAIAGEGKHCVADMEAIVRYSTEQSLVALIEMVDGANFTCWADIRANVVNGVVAIAVATPTEVKMEEDLTCAVLIAIAHKAVSTLGSHTTIDNGVLQT